MSTGKNPVWKPPATHWKTCKFRSCLNEEARSSSFPDCGNNRFGSNPCNLRIGNCPDGSGICAKDKDRISAFSTRSPASLVCPLNRASPSHWKLPFACPPGCRHRYLSGMSPLGLNRMTRSRTIPIVIKRMWAADSSRRSFSQYPSAIGAVTAFISATPSGST